MGRESRKQPNILFTVIAAALVLTVIGFLYGDVSPAGQFGAAGAAGTYSCPFGVNEKMEIKAQDAEKETALQKCRSEQRAKNKMAALRYFALQQSCRGSELECELYGSMVASDGECEITGWVDQGVMWYPEDEVFFFKGFWIAEAPPVHISADCSPTEFEELRRLPV